MNILIILEDALRPDHMGCYGYPKNTTPNCDRLAREGTLFECCIAVSAHTVPSIVSLLTGQTPFTHGLMTARDYTPWKHHGLWEDRRTPLRVLAEEGYLVDGELVMRWSPLGFERDANDLLVYMQENRARKWFYCAEPYPTHLPYNPPQDYYEEFVDEGFRPSADMLERMELVKTRMILHPPGAVSAIEAGQEDSIGQADEAHARSVATVEFRPEDEPGIRALYDGEVRVFDDLVGQWVGKLEELDLLESTLIVIIADHGEELLERGHVGHTSCNLRGTLYDECLQVPFIMRYPRAIPAGTVVRQQVSQVDLMPTIFDLVGLDLPPPVDGESLLPLISGKEAAFREEAYAETPPAGWQALDGDERRIRCVRTRDWKLIVNTDLSTHAHWFELYDLREDPGEQRNRADEEPERVQTLLARLNAHMESSRDANVAC